MKNNNFSIFQFLAGLHPPGGLHPPYPLAPPGGLHPPYPLAPPIAITTEIN